MLRNQFSNDLIGLNTVWARIEMKISDFMHADSPFFFKQAEQTDLFQQFLQSHNCFTVLPLIYVCLIIPRLRFRVHFCSTRNCMIHTCFHPPFALRLYDFPGGLYSLPVPAVPVFVKFFHCISRVLLYSILDIPVPRDLWPHAGTDKNMRKPVSL
jgi:hypothetical protein